MKRSELNLQLNQIKNTISILQKKKFRYFIHGKYITGFGALQLINDLETITKAFSFVKSQFQSDKNLSDIELELGIKSNEKEKDEQTYLGFSLSEWKDEFKVRVEEIQNQNNIEQLQKALKKLKSYRTEDQKFEEDVNKFSKLFDELGIDVSKQVTQIVTSENEIPGSEL